MLSIICEVEFKEEETNEFRRSKSYSNLVANKHLETIDSSAFFKDFIQNLKSNSQLTAETTHEPLEALTLNYIKDNQENSHELVCLAVSCLQSFAQANWLGPLPAQISNLPLALQQEAPIDINKRVFYLRDVFTNEVIK